jgi:hypothetical protein
MGLAQSMMILARPEHGPTRSLLGHVNTKPDLGHAWASPQARWARHSTMRHDSRPEWPAGVGSAHHDPGWRINIAAYLL